MAKKSIVQNGWIGGINHDKERTDRVSDDAGGKNELWALSNGLVNLNGQCRLQRVDTATESLTVSTNSNASTTTIAAYAGTVYKRQGVYKMGSNIEWSSDGTNAASTVLNRPTQRTLATSKASRNNISADSIGLNAYQTTDGDNVQTLWLGKDATGNTGNAVLADRGYIPATATVDSTKFVRWATDERYVDLPEPFPDPGANDEKFHEQTFSQWKHMGFFHAHTDQTIGFWDRSGSGDPGDATDHSPTIVESEWGYKANTDDAEGGRFLTNGGHDVTTTSDAANEANCSIEDADYIRFGNNSTADSVAEFADWGVSFRVGAVEVDSDTDEPDGLYGAGMNVDNSDIYIELQLNTTTGSAANSGGTFWTGFNYLNITLDSFKDNTTIDYYDIDDDNPYSPNSKTFVISKAELDSAGAAVAGSTSGSSGGTRIKIPWSSAVHTGSDFLPGSVKQVVVILQGGDMEGDASTPSDPMTTWCCRLFEVSFVNNDASLGWSGTKSLFAQTKVDKSDNDSEVESLIQYYEGTLEVGAASAVTLEIYEPTDDTYEGKLYYQAADGNGIGTGSLFKVADVSKTKGVKTVASENYIPWTSFTQATCTITKGDTNTITSIPDTSQIKVGMLVSHADIPPNTYVTAVTSGTAIEMSTTIAGVSAATNQTITFSGIATIDVTSPPLSSTYQFESGYPEHTKTINAIWDIGAVVGRQAYIAGVIRTGKDLKMDLQNAATTELMPANYPMLDTTYYSGTATKIVKIKMIDGDSYYFSITDAGTTPSASTSGPQDINATAGTYQYLDVDNAGNSSSIKVAFPKASSASFYTAADEWTFTITKEEDRILKTPPGKRWGFSDLNYVDLELPGTGITAMYAAGDRLCVFSENELILINVAQDYEFLEASLPGYGVKNMLHVCRVGEGLAFRNNTGVYYFDGNKINNLVAGKREVYTLGGSATAWGESDEPILYMPEQQLLVVWTTYSPSANAVACYSFITESWVGDSHNLNHIPTTQCINYAGVPLFMNGDNDYKTEIIDTDSHGNHPFTMRTGAITCGDLSRDKKFIRADINCANGAELTMKYAVDGAADSAAYDLSDGLSKMPIGETGKSIVLLVESDSTVDSGTVISDITLIYRDKRIK